MSELKPCPFCGKEAELIDCEVRPRWFVKCSNKYCGAEQGYTYVDKKSAIKAWNRRKDDVTITPKEFKERMAHIAEIDDEEARHSEMDDFMVEVLNQLGYEEGTKIFEDVEKWYS